MKSLVPLVLLLIAVPTFGWSRFSSATIPTVGVVYTSHGALIIKDAAGKTVRTIRANVPIGSFSISPDRRSVVFAPPGRKCSAPGLGRQGGPLYLLTLSTGQMRQLITDRIHIYSEREVYADPDFSPDGTQIVFAIHSESCGDAVMTAGPYALLDRRTHVARTLASTVDPGGHHHGPAYGFDPRWSPDGQRILVNFDDAFDITTASSSQLLGVSTSKNWIPTAMAMSGTTGVGWLGNRCVVFAAGEGNLTSTYVLNLDTHRTESLARFLGMSSDQTTDLVAFSPTIWVRRLGDKLIAETPHGSWSIDDVDQHTYLRVISSWTGEQVPLKCR